MRKYPQRGDISARSALTIHRGTPQRVAEVPSRARARRRRPGRGNAAHHDMAVTQGYWERAARAGRAHLKCPVVDELTPITQKHTIEGLVMGEA